MDSARIAPDLLQTTVKIISRSPVPGRDTVGSGFFVTCQADPANANTRAWFLVTNKHVIGDWNLGDGDILSFFPSLTLHCYGASGAILPFTLSLVDANGMPLADRVFLHPAPTVDVAMVYLTLTGFDSNNFAVMSFDPSYLIPFASIANYLTGLGDQVFALGYPHGITSFTTSHPIAKSGYLATVPGRPFGIEVPAQRRNGSLVTQRIAGSILVVDGLIVPGNSGGPIILPADLRVRRNPVDQRLEFGTENLKNYVIGMVSMGLGASGLTLAFAMDYVSELLNIVSQRHQTQPAP